MYGTCRSGATPAGGRRRRGVVAVIGGQHFGAGLQCAHRALRQSRLHPAAGFMQALAAAGILRCGAVVVQRSRRQRRPVVRPAPAAAPTPAC